MPILNLLVIFINWYQSATSAVYNFNFFSYERALVLIPTNLKKIHELIEDSLCNKWWNTFVLIFFFEVAFWSRIPYMKWSFLRLLNLINIWMSNTRENTTRVRKFGQQKWDIILGTKHQNSLSNGSFRINNWVSVLGQVQRNGQKKNAIRA